MTSKNNDSESKEKILLPEVRFTGHRLTFVRWHIFLGREFHFKLQDANKSQKYQISLFACATTCHVILMC